MTRLLAVVAAGFALLLAVVPGNAEAAPSSSACVGLVVDFGGGSVQSTCVPYHQGLTGTEVLTTAKHKLIKARSGLICEIDAHPSSCTSDNKHYWSYYHRAPGRQKWAFSMKGPDQYQVHPGETEGWAWVSGTSTREPKTVPYAQLQAAAAPTAVPLKPSASSKSSATPSSKPSSNPSSKPSSAASDGDSGSGTPWGLIIGIIVVVVVGAAAFLVQRARRSQP